MHHSPTIADLSVLPEFITKQEEQALLECLDQEPWMSDLKRRVQHYGYRYDYRARKIDRSMHLGPLPEWTSGIVDRLGTTGIFPNRCDQLIVNEYLPGQGISPHVDCLACFDEPIVSLSLGSGCTMLFTHDSLPAQAVYLAPRSAVVMSGLARQVWRHAIPPRKSDLVNGKRIPRGRRVSLTFRKVQLDGS